MKKKMLILVYCLGMTLLTSCVPTSNASNTVGVYNEIEIIENTNETIEEIEEVIPEEKDIVEFEEPTVVETEEEIIEEVEAEVKEKTKETEETIEGEEEEEEEEEQEEIKEEIPATPIATPTPVATPEPTPTPVPTETQKPEVEVIEEEDKEEVETPTANITIIKDVDLSKDLKDLWKQYPENHFNQKSDSYIYYQSRDNFVIIHVQKRGDGAYMISASQTNLGKDMDASQFAIVKKVLEATVENSEELYSKFVEGYNGWYLHGDDSLEAVYKSLQWRDANTSFSDDVEKWKTLGNIEYKFELKRGVALYFKAK